MKRFLIDLGNAIKSKPIEVGLISDDRLGLKQAEGIAGKLNFDGRLGGFILHQGSAIDSGSGSSKS